MHDVDDINSILEAVNKINLKSSKKSTNILATKNSTTKLNHDLKISPDVARLIQEAEEYKKNSEFKLHQFDSNEKQKNLKKKLYDKTFDDIQTQIVDDLYSKFTKKYKKNTLRIIFNLRLENKNLKNKLENYETKETQVIQKKPLLKEKSSPNTDKYLILNNKDIIRNEVTSTLLTQDSTIELLKKQIKNFKESEEKLRFQIIDIEQDKSILLQKIKKLNEFKNYEKNNINTKEKLKSIYKQVEVQKRIFILLTNHSTKIKQELSVFKESYERLIIENSEIKKRLVIAKEQIIAHEKNKLDLTLSINQLNEIISKENIVKNISSPKTPFEESNFTISKKNET